MIATIIVTMTETMIAFLIALLIAAMIQQTNDFKVEQFLWIPWPIRIDVISVNTYSHELNTVLWNIINLNIHIYSSVHIVQTVFNV